MSDFCIQGGRRVQIIPNFVDILYGWSKTKTLMLKNDRLAASSVCHDLNPIETGMLRCGLYARRCFPRWRWRSSWGWAWTAPASSAASSPGRRPRSLLKGGKHCAFYQHSMRGYNFKPCSKNRFCPLDEGLPSWNKRFKCRPYQANQIPRMRVSLFGISPLLCLHPAMYTANWRNVMKKRETVQGDPSCWWKPAVDLVPTILAAGGPLL